MKKYIKIITPIIFTLLYGTLLSLGVMCFLTRLSFSFAVSPDPQSPTDQYPRFFLFISIAGFLALVAIVCLLLLNLKIAEKLDYLDVTWILQLIGAIVISIPMMKVWEMFFDFLQATF